MFQSHIERFSPCRGGPQVRCARPDRERQRPGLLVLRLTPGRWNPDLSMRRMMGRARGRRIGVRHFLPRMKWTTTTTTRAKSCMRYIGILLEFSENMRYIGIPDPQNEVYWYESKFALRAKFRIMRYIGIFGQISEK